MKWYVKLVIGLFAIAVMVSAFKPEELPAHNPNANVVGVAHSYSGGGEFSVGNFRCYSVNEAYVTSYDDNWVRIDYIKTDGAIGIAWAYKPV